jgi:predicted oxidoreductase
MMNLAVAHGEQLQQRRVGKGACSSRSLVGERLSEGHEVLGGGASGGRRRRRRSQTSRRLVSCLSSLLPRLQTLEDLKNEGIKTESRSRLESLQLRLRRAT